MEYKPLQTMNPTDEDLTLNSSVWLASRLMPGKGHDRVSFPDSKITHNAAMRTCSHSDLQFNGIAIFEEETETIGGQDAIVLNMFWNGIWRGLVSRIGFITDEFTIIGHCTNAHGLVAPMNTFNVGYQYRRGWRPSRVS